MSFLAVAAWSALLTNESTANSILIDRRTQQLGECLSFPTAGVSEMIPTESHQGPS